MMRRRGLITLPEQAGISKVSGLTPQVISNLKMTIAKLLHEFCGNQKPQRYLLLGSKYGLTLINVLGKVS